MFADLFTLKSVCYFVLKNTKISIYIFYILDNI